MSLVFAGVCSHAPGIVGRKDRADPVLRDGLYAAFERMRLAIEAARPDALVVIAAEHFANFLALRDQFGMLLVGCYLTSDL